MRTLTAADRGLVADGVRRAPVNPTPPSWRRAAIYERDAANLLAALSKLKGEIARFVCDLRVPPTNNEAKRSLRMVKLHKISGSFQSERHAEGFAAIQLLHRHGTKAGHGRALRPLEGCSAATSGCRPRRPELPSATATLAARLAAMTASTNSDDPWPLAELDALCSAIAAGTLDYELSELIAAINARVAAIAAQRTATTLSRVRIGERDRLNQSASRTTCGASSAPCTSSTATRS